MQRIHCETAPLTVIHNAELLRMAKGFVSRKGNNGIELAEDGLEVWRQRERYRDLRMGAKRNIKSALDKVLRLVFIQPVGFHSVIGKHSFF